jgi:hypothetical protein
MNYDVQQHKKTQKHLLLTHDDLEYTVPQSMIMNKKYTKNIKKRIFFCKIHMLTTEKTE